eukprot:167406_1
MRYEIQLEEESVVIQSAFHGARPRRQDYGVTAAEYMVDSLWGHLPCFKKTTTTQRSRRQTDRPPPRKRRKVPNCRRAKPSLVPQEDDPLIAMEKATAVARSERSKKQKLQSDKSPVPAPTYVGKQSVSVRWKRILV